MSDAESPLSIFESYEHDFQALIREIKSKLDGEGSNASSGSRLATGEYPCNCALFRSLKSS